MEEENVKCRANHFIFEFVQLLKLINQIFSFTFEYVVKVENYMILIKIFETRNKGGQLLL